MLQTPTRQRPDRCPGITRPWIADDGALVRVRVVGGTLSTRALRTLVELAATYADGDVHLTGRANLQLRAVPHVDGVLPDGLVEGLRGAGLLPSESHELVRNVMASPLSGRLAGPDGGRLDVRPVARELDRLLLADPECAGLAGRFLFLLDDGRGDLLGRTSDLAAVAVDDGHLQLRSGSDQWGPVVAAADAASALVGLARRFLDEHGDGPTAAWHVDELDAPLLTAARDPRTRLHADPLPLGPLPQRDDRVADHVDVPDGLLTPALAADVLDRAAGEVVVTPWRTVLLPDLERP